MPRPPLPKLLLGVALLATLAACRRAEPQPATPPRSSAPAAAAGGGVRARLELARDPIVGSVPLSVYLLDGAEGVDGARVTVTAAASGTGTAPIASRATEAGPGLYRVPDFAFPAAGDWVLTTRAELPDGRSHASETRVTVPGP